MEETEEKEEKEENEEKEAKVDVKNMSDEEKQKEKIAAIEEDIEEEQAQATPPPVYSVPSPPPRKKFPSLVIPPVSPIPKINVKKMNPHFFENIGVGLNGNPPLFVDSAYALVSNTTNTLDDLINELNKNKPQYGLIEEEVTPPDLDKIAEQFNLFFISQTEFVDIVKSVSYFKTMSRADLIARKAIDINTKLPSNEVYLAKYISSYETLNDEQKYKLIQAVSKANHLLKPYRVLHNIKWKIAKIQNGIEQSFPHTFRDTIIITDDVINTDLEALIATLIHEKIHVFQRLYNSKIQDLIRMLDFVPLSSSQVLMIDYVLRSLMRNNPDLDGNIYMYIPSRLTELNRKYSNKIIAQLYNTSEPTSLSDSSAKMISLNTYGSNSEILQLSNDMLGLPSSFRCQLEHPYEITACLITEMLTNVRFYSLNKNNSVVMITNKWMKEQLI